MGNKVPEELVMMVRSIVGQDYSDMDIIRALHMAKNDATAAINIIFDTPKFVNEDKPKLRGNSKNSPPVSSADRKTKVTNMRRSVVESVATQNRVLGSGLDVHCADDRPGNLSEHRSESGKDAGQCPSSIGTDWWFVGSSEMAGLSTCKGRKVKSGDEAIFKFPSKNSSISPSPGKFPTKGRLPAACSEIVRFSVRDSGEVSCKLFSFIPLMG